ncbi:MAG: GGDEF domain-containing protein [Rhodoferax sp.]|nr:GGDEF domain-containing protein [Rhodoferax sp.]
MQDESHQPEQLARLLLTSKLFKNVNFAILDAELSQSRTVTIDVGEVLLDPKQPNADIFVVLSGEVLICLEPRVIYPLARFSVGDCVGELSAIDANPPSAYVVAAVATKLLVIPKLVLWRMLELAPVMALNLLHVLSTRIRENNVILLGSLARQREYRNKAEIDALTGLYNRAWFAEVFPQQLELCERTGQQASLLLLDIDHFKKVNDNYGHLGGDEALRHVGLLLRNNLRSTDLCARYGGEEIVVLMPGTELAEAKLAADRLREIIAAAPCVLPDGRSIKLQISGGLAQWEPGSHLNNLISAADLALYLAKEGGRNQICASTLTLGRVL